MRVRDKLVFGSFLAEHLSGALAEKGNLLHNTPEAKLYIAVINRGLMDYWNYMKLSQRRPLNHIQRRKLNRLYDWLFIDDPEYLSLFVLCELVSDYYEPLLAKIREVARNDLDKLQLSSKGFLWGA